MCWGAIILNGEAMQVITEYSPDAELMIPIMALQSFVKTITPFVAW